MTGESDNVAATPLLRIVHGGEPTADELAALVVALRSRPTAEPPAARSRWADREAGLRRPPTGAGAWRASGRMPGVRTRAGV